MPRSNAQHNARLGLRLFGLYVVLYATYVFVNAFSPDTMERTPWLGVNVAVWSGFGLIVAAILMALAYGLICRPSDSSDQEAGE